MQLPEILNAKQKRKCIRIGFNRERASYPIHGFVLLNIKNESHMAQQFVSINWLTQMLHIMQLTFKPRLLHFSDYLVLVN